MNIYVGNISYDATEQDLRQAFGKYGEVASVNVITDRETGRPRGFAFVEMTDDSKAQQAIDALNGAQIAGRTISVDRARPKGERAFAGSGGGRRRDW